MVLVDGLISRYHCRPATDLGRPKRMGVIESLIEGNLQMQIVKVALAEFSVA